MNTNELENCLHLIGYWLNGDEEVIKILLDKKTDTDGIYIKPFTNELNMNLLSKDSLQSKSDLIKYYIFEFWELQGCFKEYSNILLNGSLANYNPIQYTNESVTEGGKVIKRKLNRFENYVVNSQIIFNILFNEIQVCCILYKIDFFALCDELKFSTDYFDSGITLGFQELDYNKLLSQQVDDQRDISVTKSSKKKYYESICQAFNCNSFFDFLNKQTDLEELGRNLEEQLRRYARSCGEGFEKGIGDLYSAGFYSREQWLKHTIFICKDEYNRTKKEIFNEAAKWCEDWHEKYLFQFNPYSPEEQAKMNKIWDIPLWEQLKNREQPKVQTNQETNSEKIARILEPIRRAFDTPDHLDSIVNALVQYSSDGMPPPKVNSKVIQFEIAKFYPFFKQVKNETGLTNKGIATVLTYFICKPNGSPILLSTIEKNIKQRY